MSNIVQVTNNVTSTSVTVNTTAGPNLTLTSNNTVNTVELNAGLFLPAPVASWGDIANVHSGVDSAAANSIAWFFGGEWTPTTISTALGQGVLTDLSDVSSGATSGQQLQWSGSAWIPVTNTLDTITSAGNTTSNNITVGTLTTTGSVNAGTVVTGTAGVISGTWTLPTANGTSGQYLMDTGWENFDQALGDLSDVVDSSANGDVIYKTPLGWRTTAPTLDFLTDVSASTPSVGQFLGWAGPNYQVLDLVKSYITDFDDADYATAAQGTNADTAFGWGDHAGLYANLSHTHGIEDLTAGTANLGDVIKFDGANWITGSVSVGTVSMDDLSDADTTTTAPVLDDYLKWDGTNWVPAPVPAAELSSDITVTDAAGNYSPGDVISSGTAFEDMWNYMLVSFQQPVLTLSGWTTGTYEHGATFNDTSYTLAFTNDSNIDVGVNGTWTTSDTYITGDTGSVAAADGSYSTTAFSGQLLVSNTSVGVGAYQRTGAAQLNVTGFKDTQAGNINSQTKSSTVRFRYWIVDSATALTIDTFTDLEGNNMMVAADPSLNGGGAGVVESGLMSGISNLGDTFAGGHDYIYWVYPAYFTVSSVVLNGSTNLYAGDEADKTTAVIHMGTFDMTNQYGETVTMDVLRTKVSNALAGGSVITVS